METGVPDAMAAEIAGVLRERGLEGEPVGSDIPDMVAQQALTRAGVRLTDGTQVILSARRLKTPDEIALLDHAAAIVDAVYEQIYASLRPGVERARGGRRCDAAAVRARL